MNITMNMSNYEIEHEETEAENGDEISCAEWNPEADSVCQQLELVPRDEQRAMPVTQTAEAVELFLRKIYSYQR